MSEAVFVNNTTKKFPDSDQTQWKYKSIPGSGRFIGQLQEVVAVDHVSFSVRQSEIFGLVGPSGSGKSTLIRMLATLLLPDSGDIRIFGYNVMRYPGQVQNMINRVSVEASFFRKLSPIENLLYGVRLTGQNGLDYRRRVIEILTRLGLEDSEIYQPMEALDRNVQQLVIVARALLCQPRLLLLDAPTSGLSSCERPKVFEILRELRDQLGITIIITMRDPSEAVNLCDQITILEAGKIVARDATSTSNPLQSLDGCEPGLADLFQVPNDQQSELVCDLT